MHYSSFTCEQEHATSCLLWGLRKIASYVLLFCSVYELKWYSRSIQALAVPSSTKDSSTEDGSPEI